MPAITKKTYMNEKIIEKKGWYAPYDGNPTIFVDKYIHFGTFVALHFTQKVDDDKEYDEWTTDYENNGEVRIYKTLEDCFEGEKAVENFEKTKRYAERVELDANVMDALTKLHEFDRFANISKILKEVGFVDNVCISEYDDFLNKWNKLAASILKRRRLRIDGTSIMLDKISHVKDNETNIAIYVGDTRFSVSKKENKTLYHAIKWIYDNY